jgi:hypothetical protein
MKIRARLIILVIQFCILGFASIIATGFVIPNESWFLAGLLAIIINPQLLEPYYPRPADIVGNSLIALILCFSTTKNVLGSGWIIAEILFFVTLTLAIISIFLGSEKRIDSAASIGKTANIISCEATAIRMYSILFWMLLIETYPDFKYQFWTIGLSWLIIVIITIVDWQKIWTTLNVRKKNVVVEGIISPSIVIVSSSNLPAEGKLVRIITDECQVEGVVVSRIRRVNDVWGQISVPTQNECEIILCEGSISVEEIDSRVQLIGSIEEGSTESTLIFYPIRPLEIGNVVSVLQDEKEVMYQVVAATIHQTDIKGGSFFHPIAKASQIGIFNNNNNRVEQLRWIPKFGSKLILTESKSIASSEKVPEGWFKIGNIVGTNVPIYLDSKIASEGHLTILGMTKMGKTSFASRYCKFLGKTKCVTILDQTGEYIKKRKFLKYEIEHLDSDKGVRVSEPELRQIAPEFAKEFFRQAVNKGRLEYEKGRPKTRIVLIDEAHQFIPEPAIIGYNGEGRDASIYISNLLMQIRKYGLSIILVSQRTAVVAKSALSQCENIIAFRSTDHTGLDYLESIVGSEVKDILPKLHQGEALIFGPAFSTDGPVVVKVDREKSETREK